jgi:hypothetical protein
MYATTERGLMRSKDGGQNWDIIYYTTYRPAGVARRLAINPHRPNEAVLNTLDGAFTTHDIVNGGIESWQRFAPLSFTGFTYLRTIRYCPKHDGHMWIVANMRLPSVAARGTFITGHSFFFESVDGGKTWRVIFSPTHYARIVWAIEDDWDPHLFLIVTDRALLRMRRRSPSDPPPPTRIEVPDDPPITDVIQAALRYTGTAPHILLSYRSRARFRSLMPEVELSYQNYRRTYLDVLQEGQYPTLPFRRWDRLRVPYDEFRVVLLWDIGDLVFNTAQYFSGRTFRLNSQLRDRIVLEVHQAYGRLRQLRVALARLPQSDRRVRLHYRTRIDETSALLNFLTDNFLARWHARRR